MVPSVPNGRPTVTNVPGTSSVYRGANLGDIWTSARPGRAGRTTSTTWNGPCSATSGCSPAGRRTPPGTALAPGIVVDRRAARPVVRRPAGEPAPRPRRSVATRSGARLLHDQLGRARGQCAGRGGAAADRSGAAALPVGRLLPRPGPAGSRARRRARRDPRAPRRSRRADRRRPAQGLRPRRSRHHSADLDDRVAPAAGARRRLRHRPGRRASACRRAGRTTPSSCAASGTPR